MLTPMAYHTNFGVWKYSYMIAKFSISSKICIQHKFPNFNKYIQKWSETTPLEKACVYNQFVYQNKIKNSHAIPYHKQSNYYNIILYIFIIIRSHNTNFTLKCIACYAICTVFDEGTPRQAISVEKV